MMQKIKSQSLKLEGIDTQLLNAAIQEYAKQEFFYKIWLLERRLLKRGFTDALDNDLKLRPEKIHSGFNSKGEHVFSYIHGIGMYEEVIVFYNKISVPKVINGRVDYLAMSTLNYR